MCLLFTCVVTLQQATFSVESLKADLAGLSTTELVTLFDRCWMERHLIDQFQLQTSVSSLCQSIFTVSNVA